MPAAKQNVSGEDFEAVGYHTVEWMASGCTKTLASEKVGS